MAVPYKEKIEREEVKMYELIEKALSGDKRAIEGGFLSTRPAFEPR